MRLWFTHRSDVSIREQLVTQVVLGIVSGDLAPGQRLPSTRELARRFRLHPNTISAGYRQLERDQWVELRHGSGVYIKSSPPAAVPNSELQVGRLIVDLFRAARGLGVPLAAVRSRIRHFLDLQPPDHFLLIEQNQELAKIIVAEMCEALTFPVHSCTVQEFLPELLEGAIPVALPGKTKTIPQMLPPGIELLTLQIRSVPSSLGKWLPTPAETLLGVASGWPDFVKLARTVLIAAGFHSDALLLRDTHKPHWHKGLEQTAAVVCDSATAKELPKICRGIVFPLLSESCINELRSYQQLVEQPFPAL